MLEMGKRGQSCWIKPPNQCHLLWPQDLEILMSCSLFGSLGSVHVYHRLSKDHSLCFPPKVFYFMLLIHQCCLLLPMSVIWEVVTARLQSVWPFVTNHVVGCSLFPGVESSIQGLALWEKAYRSPGGYRLLLHLVIKKALSHHQV